MESLPSPSPPLSVWARLAAAPGVLVSFVLACGLLFLNTYGYAARGGFVDFTVSNRANLQVLVHILAWAFGAGQTCAVLAVIKARMNLQAQNARKGVELNILSFWQAISSGSFLNTTLPPGLLAASIVCMAILAIPPLLWSGAITPVIVSAVVPAMNVSVPQYSEGTASIWNLTCDWCWASGGSGPGETLTTDGYIGDQPL